MRQIRNCILQMIAGGMIVACLCTTGISVYAEEIPFPIAWQQSAEAGAELQRERYLPEEQNWCDYPWNRGSETGQTVGLAGCSLLSVVNSLYYKTGRFLNPVEMADFTLQNGYRIPGVAGSALGFFPAFAKTYGEQYGVTFHQWTTSADTALSHVRNGGVTSSNIAGHWIAIVNYDETTDCYLILDSSQTSSRTVNITWTDQENGIAWLSAKELLAAGKTGYYGIDGRYSALYTYDCVYQKGDADGDDRIAVEDACAVLAYYANQSAGITDYVFHPLSERQEALFVAADVDEDGEITVEDAVLILSYYAQQSAGLEASWGIESTEE